MDGDLPQHQQNIRRQRHQNDPTPEHYLPLEKENAFKKNYQCQVQAKQGRNKIERGTEGWMQSELFGPTAAVGHEHFGKSPEGAPRASKNQQVRIVNELAAAFLEFVHERIFFIRVERLVKAAQLEQGLTTGEQVAEDQFLFTGSAADTHRGVPRAAGAESQPTTQDQRKDLFQRRGIGGTTIRATNHFDGGITERLGALAQVVVPRHGIIIQEIDQLAAGGLEGGIALDRGLAAAGDEDFEFVSRIIQGTAGGHGLDLGLSRAGGNHNRHSWHLVGHGAKLELVSGSSKCKVLAFSIPKTSGVIYIPPSMSSEHAAPQPATLEEIQAGWHELALRVSQLESERSAQEQEIKALRFLLERVIDHRQKSHNELVLILTNLVSKLPINDLGAIVARLVEHNTNVSQYLAALIKGTVDVAIPQPALLKTLEQTKRDLLAALQPVVEELLKYQPPLETEVLNSILRDPELFFSPAVVRAHRCYIKGYVPRERLVKEFGVEALVFFNDVTTDPKLNPHPKAEEVALAFKADFETLFQQSPILPPEKAQQLMAWYQSVHRSKGSTPEARAQKQAFLKMSFLVELLHFYENQNTEAPDAVFAQRLPSLIEQLVLSAPQEGLDENLIVQAEGLMTHVISPEHRQMIVNNIGKAGDTGKTLKFVLRLRSEKVPGPELDQEIAEFIKHLLPTRQLPAAETLVPLLKLIRPEMQRLLVRSIMRSERLRKTDAETLARGLASALNLTGLEEQIKAEETIPPELERQRAWARIKDLIARRSEAPTIAAAIRERLNAKYDSEEVKQSWITLTEADPISLIRVFSHLPYRPDGSTDSIARPVMETYVNRLVHEKYAATYTKVLNSLRNMFQAKPDSPTLVNFLALVRWVNAEAGTKIAKDIGMAVVEAGR